MSSSRPKVTLIADPGGAYAEVEVLDGNLNPVDLPHNVGRVEVKLDPGAYAVRFRAGDEVQEKLVFLQRPGVTRTVELEPSETLDFATSAPVRDTRTSRTHHTENAVRLSLSAPQPLATGDKVGTLMLFARDTEETRKIRPKDLAQGILLMTPAGEPVADLARVGERSRPQNWAGAHLALKPGPYRLRLPAGSTAEIFEQMIFVGRDWQTQVFLHGRGLGQYGTTRRIDPALTSILMARSGQGFDPNRDDFRRTEASLQALAAGREVIPPPNLERQTLWAKYQNPMLGIYGAHLHLRREKINPDLMRKVVRNLLNLVGPLPDVIAIGWGSLIRARSGKAELRQLLKQAGPVDKPPLLAASWAWLVRATAEDRTVIVPGSLADRVSGRPLQRSPWLVWHGPVETRETFKKEAKQVVQTVPKNQAAAHKVRPRGAFLQRLKQELLEPILQDAAHWGLDKLLARIARVLDTDPDAPYLIEARRFSDLERRVARFASPMADPMIRDLVKTRPRLRRRLVKPYEQRKVDEKQLVEQIGVPVGTVLRTALRVQFVLTMKPVVPRKARVGAFVTNESQGNTVLRACLETLRDYETEIFHGGSGTTIGTLEFLHLCYHNSPAADVRDPPGDEALARLLCENGYVQREDDDEDESGEGIAVRPAKIFQTLVDVREWMHETLAPRARRKGSGLEHVDAAWIGKALPSPARYKRGELFAKVPEAEKED